MRIPRRLSAVATTAVIASMALAGCTSGNDAASTEASASTALTQNTTDAYISQDLSDGQTDFVQVLNPNGGQTLSYSKEGKIKVIEEVDGKYTYAFKDLDSDGTLDPAEDWRLDAPTRATDYVQGLTKEQMSGLMLFSSHERAPGDGLTDDQKTYLSDSHLRAVLNAGTSDAKQNVQWVNQMQAYVETLASAETPYVPVNYSSDPRSDATKTGLFSVEGEISTWPSSLGLAATFNPDTVLQFSQMSSSEYRALGLGTALSPQIDLATEPRWLRASGTFGEDATMAGEMAAAYVEGFQGTFSEDGTNEGWGDDSVNAMIKHWPGDGAGEGGRESHTNAGKYEVMVGGNSAEHVSVFQQALDSAAIMTSYSITLDKDGNPVYTDAKGSSYDKGKLDALRKDNAYGGVVVTDWGVTRVATDPDKPMIATGWGMEGTTVEERHYAVIKNGTDMFGGNNAAAPVLAAYDMWQADFEAGKNDVDAKTRWQQSAQRILTMSFNNDGFDNPFLDLAASQATVGSEDKVKAGQEAQLNSIVTLKNNGAIKLDEKADFSDKTVYVPHTYDTGWTTPFGPATTSEGSSINEDVLKQYFGKVVTDEVTENADGTFTYTAPDLSEVDMVMVGLNSPDNGSAFSKSGWNEQEGSWYPLSLQYTPYTANGENVRKQSISGDVAADGTKENRSYFGNISKISNAADYEAFQRATKAVTDSGKDIPVITVLRAKNAVIPAEFEAASDAIVVGFGTADEALVQVALGKHESNGRLPIQFPKDMDTVEANKEDVAKDVTPYTDSAGHTYDYGYGLHLDGSVISD